jgi:exosortase
MPTLAAHPESRPIGPTEGLPLARLLREAARGPGRATLAGAFACLGLLGLIFAPTLGHFAYTWATDENYSHGFLVPFISLYFANEAARRGPTRTRGGVGLGVALLAAAVLGRVVTTVVPIGIVSDLAFLLGLAGVLALMAGVEAIRRYGFALGFLVFMVPLPIALYTAIASPLQRMVSRVGAGLLSLCGIPVLVQGNMMTLPGDVQMFVAEACSGMRQLTGFLALTTAVAYLSARPAWYRAVLVASSIPIALTANVLRVTLTGLIMYHLNPELAMGQFHTAEGLLMLGFGLALLAGECLLLNLIAPASPRPEEA